MGRKVNSAWRKVAKRERTQTIKYSEVKRVT